jgi:hypothetical protein
LFAKLSEGLSAHDDEHRDAQQRAPAGHELFTLRQSIEVPRRASGAPKAS